MSEEQKAVKLPYFHRTLTPEDAALIGDIRPKAISVENTGTEVTTSSGKITTSSAWNGAQTWEERNCSAWGKEKLQAVINSSDGISKSESGYAVTFNVTKTEGSASITHSRGKARFLYEWTLTADFEATGASSELWKGSAVFSDVINDQLDDIEIEVTWTGKMPAKADMKIMKDLLKKSIIVKMKMFEVEFRNIDS
jgi:activator of HSP90 ATPase